MKKRILIIIIQTMAVILSASSKLPAFGINPIQVVNEFVKSAKTADFGKLADLSCKDFELYLTLEDAKKLNLGAIGYIEEIVREERCEVDTEGLYIVISRINCLGEMNFGCFFVFKTTRGWKVYISEKYLWKYPIDELSISEIALKFYYTNKINLDVALNLAKRIVKSNPNTAESHIKLGQVYYVKGLQEDAIAEYAKAIKIKINELYNTSGKSIIGVLLGANLENYAEENIEPKEALIGTWKVLLNDSDKKIKYYVADKLYNNGFRNDDVVSLLIDKYKPDPNSETYPDSMALKRFVEVAGNASVQYLIKYAYAKAKLIGQRLSVIVDIFEKDKDNWELCWNEKPSPSKNEEKILKFCYYNQCDKVTLLNKDNIHLLISYCVSGHTFAMWGKATSQNKYSGKWIKPYGYDEYSSGDICIEFVSENKAKGWASYGEGKQVLFELRNAIIEESKRQQIPSLQEEGNDAIKNQNWNAAVQVYTKLLEIAPEDYDANANIGAAYTMINEFDLSIKHLTKAQQLKPAEYQPCYLMGVAYAKKGDKDRAIESLQDAINRRPDNDDLLVSDLGKDTNLPEDFKQEQRFKGMLAKLTFKKLISGVKDTNLFDNHFQEFPNRFEEVWDAVDYALKKQREKILQSDKQTGIIITDMTFDWDDKIYNKYYILVEKRNESLSVINFKLLTYHKINNKSTTMEEGFVKWLKNPELKPANSSYTNQVAMSFLECVRKRLKNSK